jgi:hypothetical protein
MPVASSIKYDYQCSEDRGVFVRRVSVVSGIEDIAATGAARKLSR